ncbi:MAG: ABC transporter permease [Actinobacteria bacterium 13_2_20CM_2_71_6]|nr:MAG: ABC transporter permease [Actinobacteria bacterium 13_2_20CM_2_71_6]
MLRFFIRRSLLAVLTLFAISVTTFLLFFAVPANPAATMCGTRICPADVQRQIEKDLGLDKPLAVQYGQYMKGIFVGRTIGSGATVKPCPAPCMGVSFRTGQPVFDIIKTGLPVSVSIVLGAAVVWLAIGIGLGTAAALRRGGPLDKFSIGFSLTGASMQIFVLGPILVAVFVYGLGWLPRPTYTSLFDNPFQWAIGLILPWLTLGAINSALYARLSRAQMLETLSEDFVRTAKAKGLSPRTVNFRHALRAAITPMVTIAGLDLGINLGGVVITETTFNMQGAGKIAVNAIGDLNLPVVMATVLIAATFIVVANVVVDMLYALIDPRVKLS